MPKPDPSRAQSADDAPELGDLAIDFEGASRDLVEGLVAEGDDDEAENRRAASEQVDDDGIEADFSEENIHQLPKEQQVIARRLLKLERENELLRVQVAARNGTQASKPEPAPWKPPEINQVEGYEEFQRVEYGPRMNELYRQNHLLKQQVAELVREVKTSKREDDLGQFQRDHKDWQQYEQDMLSVADKLGGVPTTYDGLVELYQTVKERRENAKLKASIQAGRKAGSLPRSNGARTQMRDRLESGNGQQARDVVEAMKQAARQMKMR